MGVFDNNWAYVGQLRNQYRPRVTTLSDVMAGNRSLPDQRPMSSLDLLRADAAKRIAAGNYSTQAMGIVEGQGPEPTGFKGMIAGALSNPVVSTVLKPLELLDIPRRVVTSTLKEVVDALPLGGDPNRRNGFWDEASVSDWIEQIKDPSFGTGRLLGDLTPNKWVNRAIGLVGDIALDPLTYVTFGGHAAAKVLGASGRSGRIVMAQRLLAKGATAERAIEVGRVGRGILTADELTKLGLDRAGVYFMGKRIAGTGRIGEAVLNSTARTRIFMGDTLRGRKVMEMFDPQDASAARKAILSGTAPPERAKEFLDIITARNYERAAWSASSRDGVKQLTDVVKSLDVNEFRQYRGTIYRVMEGTVPNASEAERTMAQKFKDFLKSLKQSVEADYKLIDPEGGFGDVEDYFPHMRTDAAIKFMRNPKNKFVAELREVIDNPTETMGVFKTRMVEKDTFFGRVLTKEDIQGGVARLNEIAREGGFVGDFFETDVAQVLGKYVNQWAEQKGVAAYMKHLWDTGTAQSMLARSTPDEKAIKRAVRSIAKAESRFDSGVSKAAKQISKLQESVSEAAGRYADNLEERIDLLGTSQDNLGSMLAARERFAAEAEEIAGALQDARRAFDDVLNLGEDAARATDVEPLSLTALKNALRVAERDARNYAESVRTGTQTWAEGVRELSRQMQFLDGFEQRAADIRERGELIDKLLNAVIYGGDVVEAQQALGLRAVTEKAQKAARLPQKQIDEIRRSVRFESQLRLKGGNMLDAVKQLRKTSASDVVSGRVLQEEADRINASIDQFDNWWKRAQGDAPLADKEFKDLTEEKVSKIVGASLRGDATPHEMRLATMWIVARDFAVHGGPIDGSTAVLVSEMIAEDGVLERAAMADKWFKNFAKNTEEFNRLNRIDKIHTNYRQIRGEVGDTVRAYAAARHILANIDSIGLSGVDPSMDIVPLLDGIVTEMPELRPLFDDVLGDEIDSYLGDSVESLMQPFEGGIGTVGRRQPMDPESAVAAVAPDAPRSVSLSLERAGKSRGDINLAMKTSSELQDQAAAVALRDRGEMSISEFIRRLEKYTDKAPSTFWRVEVETKGKANLLLGKNRTLRAADQTTVTFAGEMERVPLEVEGLVAGARTGPSTIGLTAGGKVFDMPEVAIHLDDLIDDVDNILSYGQFDRAAIEDAISARLSSIDGDASEWRKLLGNTRIIDRNGRKMRSVIDQTKDELTESMTYLWFAQSVNERMRKVTEVLRPYGLLPTEEMYRKVVNAVAKGKAEELGVQTAARHQVMAALDNIEQRINANIGGTSDPSVARQIIEEEISRLHANNPNAGEMLHRLGGLSSAGNYRKRWLAVGGASGSGERRTLSIERRAAGATEISKRERAIASLDKKIAGVTGAERDKLVAQKKAIQAELKSIRESINADPRLKAELERVTKADKTLSRNREKVRREIIAWWQDITGDDRIPTVKEIDEFLKTHANVTNGWDDPNATVRRQLAWVRSTRDRLQTSTSRVARTQAFLAQAADPWVSASELMITRDRQNLPSGFALYMEGLAERLDRDATTLGNYGTDLDRAESVAAQRANMERQAADRAAAVTGQAPPAAGSPMGNLRRPAGQGWQETTEVARTAFNRYNEIVNTEEYAMAVQRRGEHDIMDVLAAFSPMGNDMEIYMMRTARERARLMADRGEIVFWQPDDGSKPFVVDSNWFSRGNDPTDGHYFRPIDGIVNTEAERSVVAQERRTVLPAGPSKAEETATRRIENLVGAVNKQIADKQTELAAAQNAAIAARGSRAKAIARAEREIERSNNVLDLARRRLAKGTVGEEEVAAAEERLANARRSLTNAYETPMLIEDERVARLRSELTDLQADMRSESRRVRIVSEPTQVSYDGKNIIFTESEWRSLWSHEIDPIQLQGDIVSVSDRLDKLRAARVRRVDEITFGKGRKVRIPRSDADFYVAADRTIREIDGQIDESQRMLNGLLRDQESLDKAVRDSALQKVQWLRQGIKEQQISVDNLYTGMYKKGRAGLSEDMTRRRDYLAKIWSSSPEAKMLDEVDYLRESAAYAYATSRVNDADAARRYADEARQQADHLRRLYLNQTNKLEEESITALSRTVTAINKLPEPLRGPLEEKLILGFSDAMVGARSYDSVFKEIAEAARAQLPERSPLVQRNQEELDSIAKSVAHITGKSKSTRLRVQMTAARVQDDKVALAYLQREVEGLTQRLQARRERFYIWRNREIVQRGEQMLGMSEFAQRAEQVANDARAAYDNASFVLNEKLSDATIPMLRERLANIEWAIANMSEEITDLDSMHRFIGEARNTLQLLEEGGEDVSALTKLLADENLKTYELLTSRRDMQDLRSVTDEMVASIPRLLEDGWVALGDIGLPNTVVRKELKAMFQNMTRLNQPAITRELGKFLSGYTQFFKAYATLSPGFTIRNALSNTFMLIAAGSDIGLMGKSFKLARGYLEAFNAGTLPEFLAAMPETERKIFEVALQATDASGGGRSYEALAGFMPKRNILKQNAAIKASGAFNQHVEFVSRFMLSYDTVVQGMRAGARKGEMFIPEELFTTAAQRTKKYLIDYVDRGVADETVQNIIPFWMWMSRNFPLQIVNQWSNPKAYAMFNSLMRNISTDDKEDIVPSWLREQGAVKVAQDWYLAPDFGFNRIQQQAAEFADPVRMLSYVNPAIRLPVELAGNRKLYNSVPFSDKPQQVTGGPLSPLIAALLRLAGQTEQTASGETVTNEKANYALMNSLPFLSQAERLVPSTDSYKARQLGSWLSYFGVPLRQITPQMRESELKRRQRQLQNLANHLRDLGYTQ